MAANGEDGHGPLTLEMQKGALAILHGGIMRGDGQPDGVSKDEALEYAADLARFVLDLAPVGSWCPFFQTEAREHKGVDVAMCDGSDHRPLYAFWGGHPGSRGGAK